MNPENKAQIQSNRRKIFELEILINSNKTKVEVCRASIEQNYASIMRNYNAAYMGNHHLANQETDEILRNRLAIMSNMIAERDVEINFRESMNNKAQLDFLEHKSSVNKTILEVNKQLTEINKKLIELNRMIMKKNEETLQFNTENLATNEKFLKGEFHPSKATEKDNKKRIEQNKKRALQDNVLFKKRLITIDLVKQKIWETDIGSKSGGREFNCSIIDLQVPEIKKSENQKS